MLLDFEALAEKYELVIHDVIHVGAHTAEEAPIYSRLSVERVIWIEPNADLLPRIAQSLTAAERTHDSVFCELITDLDDDEREFNVTNIDGLSSSVFEFGTHPQFSPEIHFVDRRQLTTRTLNSLYFINGRGHGEDNLTIAGEKPWNVNMLNMDIQGAEMLALNGAGSLLPNIDIVMTEVNEAEVYQGCAKIWEIDALLEQYDLHRVETTIVPGQGWGDAMYLRP